MTALFYYEIFVTPILNSDGANGNKKEKKVRGQKELKNRHGQGKRGEKTSASGKVS